MTTGETHPLLKRFGLLFLVLLGIASGFLGGWLGSSSHEHQQQIDSAESRELINSESALINEVAEDVGSSVVSVNVTSTGKVNDYFGRSQSVEEQSAGTGIILNKDGIIITNRHVVPEGSNQVSVVLSDGTELEHVEVLGRTNPDDPLDVAFLKVTDKEGKDLTPANLGDSSAVKVGDKVIAIGNALGQFQNTVTSGIISGYGRSLTAGDGGDSENLQNLFQTDAAINHGNSGGPLVDIHGKVIGINTAVAGDGAENIGFAIPINDVQGLIDTVLETGKFERPYLGVRYVNLTDDIAAQYKLDVKRGAFILPESDSAGESVLSGSPAAKAGLKPEDIITKVGNEDVNEKNSLISLIGKHKVGEEVTLTVYRDGKYEEIKVTLEAQPATNN